MGNQQSGGTQFCSRGQFYTYRDEMSSCKMDPVSRIGYDTRTPTKPTFQRQRIQEAPQQFVSQQQNQEEIEEIPLSGPGMWKIPKSFFDTWEDEVETVEKREPSFNVYISCLDNKEEVPPTLKTDKAIQEVEAQMIDYHRDDLSVLEGLDGNFILNKNGLVLYTDMSQKKHCEEYDRYTIKKIFPMGISFGGLTKSIWFKDAVSRDQAFDLMISMPPTYQEVIAEPEKFFFPKEDVVEDDENDNMKIFEGMNNTNVILHADNLVLYTDINETKHCIKYNKHKIGKCFPNGICDGGLPKAIWFNEEMERDLCFMLMQWNMEEECDAKPQDAVAQKFTGLYGGVVLHPDSQIEFSSLSGEHIKCYYEPSEIVETFPKGISYGRLPKTIWFRDVKEQKKCFEAMREMC